MEYQSSSQPTLHEFFSPSKSQRIWLLILSVLTSLMIIGAAYEITKPKPEPIRMTHDLSSGVYAYLDMQLLSDWVYDVSGEENYTFYEAMDADETWFLVALDKETFSQYSAYVDAYNAYFSDDYQSYSYPEPVRLTGMTSYIGYDDTSSLAEFYEASTSEVANYFGAYYLNEGADNSFAGAVLYVTFGALLGIFVLVLALSPAFITRRLQKSMDHLYALGKQTEADLQFNDPDIERYDKLHLALSKDFVYSGTSGYILPYSEIGWLYKRVRRSYGITVATQLVAGTADGKTVVLAAQKASDDFIANVAQKVLAKNPNCLIGYSFDRSKLYYQRVKEYKANNRA